MQNDIKEILDLLNKINFPLARLEKITFFEKEEWEKLTDDINKGWWLINDSCKTLLAEFEKEVKE